MHLNKIEFEFFEPKSYKSIITIMTISAIFALAFLAFISPVLSAVASCCESCACNNHTIYYNEAIAGNISLATLTMRETYLPRHGFDPCKPYVSRSAYIADLMASGARCVDTQYALCDSSGGFSCVGRGLDCWQVEHIYDLANSPFSNNSTADSGAQYNLNIYGNIIMSYGRWNNAIGQKSWEIVEIEKRFIYSDIMQDASIYLHMCADIADSAGSETLTSSFDYLPTSSTVSIGVLVLVILISVCISFALTLFILYKIYIYYTSRYVFSDEMKENFEVE